MPSNAFEQILGDLIGDAEDLNEARLQLPAGIAGIQRYHAAMNRSVVIGCVSAWEAYIESLVLESIQLLRPLGAPLGHWPVHNAFVRGQVGRFHNPNMENIRVLLSDSLGLQNVQHSWNWQNSLAEQTIQRLAAVLNLRHQIAHGVNPRPIVSNVFARQLPQFFARLAERTDHAVRDHLVDQLGISNPWPS